MSARSASAAALLLALTASTVRAQDWPRWRGADGDGVAECADWSPHGRELWRRDVGLGFSGASVVGERAYTLGFDAESSRDRLWCLDASTGAVVWTAEHPGRRNTANRHDGGTLRASRRTRGGRSPGPLPPRARRRRRAG